MFARLLRFVAILAVMAGVVYAASWHSRRTALLALLVLLILAFVVRVWLPRAAHRAFKSGRFQRATVLYHALRWLRLGRDARASVVVSLAACSLGREDPDTAIELLDGVELTGVADSVRAAWLNNRAYALSRAGRAPRAALSHSDEAIELRPDVAGFHHTRGIALLGLGRTDDAIRELDSLWSKLSTEDAKPLLEAERCYDLALAWRAKGEQAYALDYFHRARRAAPDSIWAARADEHVDHQDRLSRLASLIDTS